MFARSDLGDFCHMMIMAQYLLQNPLYHYLVMDLLSSSSSDYDEEEHDTSEDEDTDYEEDEEENENLSTIELSSSSGSDKEQDESEQYSSSGSDKEQDEDEKEDEEVDESKDSSSSGSDDEEEDEEMDKSEEVSSSSESDEEQEQKIETKNDAKQKVGLNSSEAPAQSLMNASTEKRSPRRSLKMPAARTDNNLTTRDMIIHAVYDLHDKKGPTISAIKKYLASNFTATEKRLKMVDKLLKQANEDGWLVQVSGHGASADSHFKLSEEMKKYMMMMAKKRQATAKKDEKEQAMNEKKATKREAEKVSVNKEVPSKKKKVFGPPKLKIATKAARKMAS